MSIIIRLQNLPLSAKSEEIRRFFGGLRIPNGGVHIIGGEKGDAFIVFNSDEDARLAMRKDGQRILDAQVKLYLSSHMELKHEIGKVTKKIPDISGQRSSAGRQRSSRSPLIERDARRNRPDRRSRSPSRGRRYCSPRSRGSPRVRSKSPRRSPRRSRSPRRGSRSPKRMSRSPRKFRSRRRSISLRRSRSPRRYSRSPRRLSKSPGLSFQRSRSPLSQRSSAHSRQMTPVRNHFKDSNYGNEKDDKSYKDANLLKLKKIFGLEATPKEVFDWQSDELSRQKEQALFEQKLAEALAAGLSSMGKVQDAYHSSKLAQNSELNRQVGKEGVFLGNLGSNFMPYKSGLHEINTHDNNHLLMSNMLFAPNMIPTESFVPNTLSLQHSMSIPPSMNKLPMLKKLAPSISMATLSPSLPMSPVDTSMSSASIPPRKCKNMFYVTLSGLKPGWDFRITQDMLKGAFVTKENIVRERNDFGAKTGTIYVKFCNREDFKSILKHPAYFYKKRLIKVGECPESVFSKHFVIPSEEDTRSRGLYYVQMKGLPYDVTPEHVVHFFEGLAVVDLYIVYAKYSKGYVIEGKAVGIAFVAFGNFDDYEKAFKKNGELFRDSNRTIHFMKSAKSKMQFIKHKNKDLLCQSAHFVPACISDSVELPDLPEKRPLCTLVTGLPPHTITRNSLLSFFQDKGSSPSFIYLQLDSRGNKPCGRAFIAFDTLQNFDLALQCHGSKMLDNIICVKQILHDEMLKCLPLYERHLHIKKLQENWKKQADQERKMKLSLEDDYIKSPISPGRSDFLLFENEIESRNSIGDNYHNQSLSPELPFKSKDLDVRKKSKKVGIGNLEVKIQQAIYKTAKVENALGSLKKRMRVEEAMHVATTHELASSKKAKFGSKQRRSRCSHNITLTLPSNPSVVRNVRCKSRGSEPISREHSPVMDFRKRDRNVFRAEHKSSDWEKDVRIDEDRWSSPPRSVRRISSSRSPCDQANYSNLYTYSYDEKHDNYEEAVVQICNVDPVIGSPELMDFFVGFDIDIDKIVRRVTARGEPTGDVRVTFENCKDAERAVRILNGSFISGVPVDMFLVS